MDRNKKENIMDRCSIDISDKDIYAAMKEIPGYLDITLEDLKEVYRNAYQHAVARFTSSITAKDVMTAKVVSVRPETPLHEVAKAMAKHGISGVPVVVTRRVIGVISQVDFLSLIGIKKARTIMDVLVEYLKGKSCATEPLKTKLARDIMSSPAITVNEDASIEEIVDIFTTRHINRVPVLNKKGNLVGIVSRDDIVKASFGGM